MKINGLSSALGTLGTAVAGLMATGQIPTKYLHWAALALALIHVAQTFTGGAVSNAPQVQQASQDTKSISATSGQ